MSSRVRGVSSSSLLDVGDGGFIRTARLGAALGVLGSCGAFCSFLGLPRFFLVQELELACFQALHCLATVLQE